ncbi:MAG: hypothetical protein DYH08_13610 [Actinobacteria bacterium ATB1]|nr:hypothetical protein [Actinobacteria bacterium ATB1]
MTDTVLVVCAANRIRSPMYAAALRRHLDARGRTDVLVRSAGLLEAGRPAIPEAVTAMTRFGDDLRSHTSTFLTSELADASDLIVTMTTRLRTEVGVVSTAAEQRAFTAKELDDRARGLRPIQDGETLREWATFVGSLRTRQELLTAKSEWDIPDPLGRPLSEVIDLAYVLENLAARLAQCWPSGLSAQAQLAQSP